MRKKYVLPFLAFLLAATASAQLNDDAQEIRKQKISSISFNAPGDHFNLYFDTNGLLVLFQINSPEIFEDFYFDPKGNLCRYFYYLDVDNWRCDTLKWLRADYGENSMSEISYETSYPGRNLIYEKINYYKREQTGPVIVERVMKMDEGIAAPDSSGTGLSFGDFHNYGPSAYIMEWTRTEEKLDSNRIRITASKIRNGDTIDIAYPLVVQLNKRGNPVYVTGYDQYDHTKAFEMQIFKNEGNKAWYHYERGTKDKRIGKSYWHDLSSLKETSEVKQRVFELDPDDEQYMLDPLGMVKKIRKLHSAEAVVLTYY